MMNGCLYITFKRFIKYNNKPVDLSELDSMINTSSSLTHYIETTCIKMMKVCTGIIFLFVFRLYFITLE